MPEALQNWGWFWYLVVFGYGAIVGSFLNVLVYRMPLGMNVSRPASHCPHCNHYLSRLDNIPLLSFLFLGARCRYCRAPISWRYFGVELLTGSLWVTLFWRLSGDTGVSWINYVACALFASVLIALIFIDLDHFFVPDELNWVGLALGVGRDVLCLLLAWWSGYGLAETREQFTYFGWLPRSVVGALVYGGLLLAVSFFAFLYYAREEHESLAQTARRFFTYEETEAETDLPVTPPPAATQTPALTGAANEFGGGTVALPADTNAAAPVLAGNAASFEQLTAAAAPTRAQVFTPAFGDGLSGEFAAGAHPGEQNAPNEQAEDGENEPGDADEADDAPPVRLQFSPAFLAAVAALLLVPALGAWAVLAFVVPLFGFAGMSRRANEPAASALGRFFRSNDQAYAGDTGDAGNLDPVLAGTAAVSSSSPPLSAEAQASAELAQDADQFAREAETGRHGGMGLGDVKLALAIGALLGPGQAVLSLLVAAGAGAVVGIALMLIHGRNMRLGLPFVPFMALGALIVLLFGQDLVGWYLQFSGLR